MALDKCACGCGHQVREGQRFSSLECLEKMDARGGRRVTLNSEPVTLNSPASPLKRGRPVTLSDDERKQRVRDKARRARERKG